MASVSVAFPLSNGAGALLNDMAVDLADYSSMYVIAALLCASGFVLNARNWSGLKSHEAQ